VITLTRNYLIWDQLAVFGPVVTVLVTALVFVTALSMPQQEGKVEKVKVRNGSVKTTWKTPSQRHHQVSKIVDMARISPPSTGHKTSSSLSFNVFDVYIVSSE
jgi:hypothetical protein